jgi:hypothetical protein
MAAHEEVINNGIAFVVQVTGGLLVLISIDSNIGILRGSSLDEEFIQYLRSCPLFKRGAVAKPGTGNIFYTGGRPEVRTRPVPKTVEERLDYLQEQFDTLQKQLEKKLKSLNEKIDQKSKEMSASLNALSQSLRKFENCVDQISVGGAKFQFFGVLLLIYGAIINYYF